MPANNQMQPNLFLRWAIQAPNSAQLIAIKAQHHAKVNPTPKIIIYIFACQQKIRYFTRTYSVPTDIQSNFVIEI